MGADYLELMSRMLVKPHPPPSKEKEASLVRRAEAKRKTAMTEEFEAAEVAKWVRRSVPKLVGSGCAVPSTIRCLSGRPAGSRSRPET